MMLFKKIDYIYILYKGKLKGANLVDQRPEGLQCPVHGLTVPMGEEALWQHEGTDRSRIHGAHDVHALTVGDAVERCERSPVILGQTAGPRPGRSE